MLLRYFYNAKLAHASYLVGCQATGEAIVVDPARDIAPYLAEARAQGLRLVAAAETHIHADFVSGARELAERTGATLFLSGEGGAGWEYGYLASYPHRLLRDGDAFKVGNLVFETMHTPGHTPEHLSFLLTDRRGAAQPMGLFSGDFVFVGSVGRPRPAGKCGRASGHCRGPGPPDVSLDSALQTATRLFAGVAGAWGGQCLRQGARGGAVQHGGLRAALQLGAPDGGGGRLRERVAGGQPEPPIYFSVMKRVNRDGPALLGSPPLPRPACPTSGSSAC